MRGTITTRKYEFHVSDFPLLTFKALHKYQQYSGLTLSEIFSLYFTNKNVKRIATVSSTHNYYKNIKTIFVI